MIAVILAGGSGTRFWPLSREARPKQLIRLFGTRPMIGETVSRLADFVRPERVLVVSGKALAGPTRAALPELDEKAFVFEPCPRNTAPAIGLAAIHALARFGDEVIGVFPSDHYIGDVPAFLKSLALAEAVAETGAIVTLGITPSRPETGFGYIRFDRTLVLEAEREGREGYQAFKVDAFVEKPDRATAEAYLASGDYVWNSGMFVFKPSTLLAEIARQLPAMHEGLQTIASAIGTDAEDAVLEAIFPSLEKISIDYGVMEQAENIAVIPTSIAWSDVGHWAAVDEVRPTDEAHNVVDANAVLHDIEGCVVYSETRDRLIAMAGTKDLIVVDTPDALLIIPRDRAQDVRTLVDLVRTHDESAL